MWQIDLESAKRTSFYKKIAQIKWVLHVVLYKLGISYIINKVLYNGNMVIN